MPVSQCSFLWHNCLALAVLCLTVPQLPAQVNLDNALPGPRLLTVFPPGGQIGTTVEVSFSGTDLEDPEQMIFSHPGIQAKPVIPPPPPAGDPKKPMPMPLAKPAITKFQVSIASTTPLGLHDVRIVNKWGVSNPRAFAVGDLPEVLEKEPNNDIDQAQKVELNTTINGNMASPTDVDYSVFSGKSGQRVVFRCQGSTLDSRFNAGLEIYDKNGRQLASNRNYTAEDALTDCVLPADGDYYVRLFHFTHTAGTAEHFYRLTITTAPWIDTAHPRVLEPGKATQVTLFGRNLPGGKLDPDALEEGRPLERLTILITAPKDPGSLISLNFSEMINPTLGLSDGFEYRIKNAAGTSNPFLFTFARAPLIVEAEGVRTAENPQPITPPCEVSGYFNKRRERDWYVFTAKKGDVYNIEIHGDRIGSPAIPYFVIRNLTTNQDMAESQDNPETLNPKYFARTDDPLPYRFVAPVDGNYRILVGSRIGDTTAGPRHGYRLRVSQEQPDFRLYVTTFANARPDAALIGQGGVLALNVIALRQDGFNGDISLSVEGLPPGVTCAPQTLGAGVKQGALILQAAENAAPTLSNLRVKGTATVAGQKIEREARFSSIVWPLAQPQPNTPVLSRLDRSLPLAVRDKAPYRLEAVLDKPYLQHGDKGQVTLKLTRGWPAMSKVVITAQIADAPANVLIGNNQAVTIAADKNEAVVPVQVNANAIPGVYSLSFRTSSGPQPFTKDSKDPKQPPKPTNIVQASGFFTLTVLPKTVGTVTLSSQAVMAKIGMPVELTVKVARQFGYAGELKAQVVLPANTKGITAADVVIPAGKDEAKLTFIVAPDAIPGNRPNLIVRTTGTLPGGLTAVQDAPPLSINIVK